MPFVPVFWILALVLLFLWIKKRKKKGEKAGGAPRSEALRWVNGVVERAVQEKTELPKSACAKTFHDGEPDDAVVSAVESVLAEATMQGEKLPNGEVSIRVTVRFEDGGREEATKRFPIDAVPQAMKDDLARTGAAYAYATWSAPWH